MGPIVGIGESLWDVYPDGRKVPGGAPFNFAFHCHQLGHEGVIVSRVGDDELGERLLREVNERGLIDSFLTIDSHRPTGTVQVELNRSGMPTYRVMDDVAWDYIGENVQPPAWGHLGRNGLSDGGRIDEIGFRHDVLAICYGTLAQRSPTSRSTIQDYIADRGNMPQALRVFDVNLRPNGFTREILDASSRAADWIKVNDDELRVLSDRADPTEAMKELAERYFPPLDPDGWDSVRLICRTAGAEGAIILPQSGEPIHVPAVPARAVDTVGAGDAFTAALLCLHLEGKPLIEAARFASAYAAKVCEHVGATPVIDRKTVTSASTH
jgi:fructokinase